MDAVLELQQEYDVGVIGAGAIAFNLHLPVLYGLEEVNVAYVYDIDHDRAAYVADIYHTTAVRTDDAPGGLPECDAVLLAVPIGVRGPYVEEFGERGTTVFTEKPFAATTDEHDRFLEQADAIGCNYMRTGFNCTRQIKNIITSELFGRLNRIQFHETKHGHGTSRGKGTYQTNPDLSGGGVVVETGSHMLSQLEYILEGYDISVVDSRLEYVKPELDTHVEADLVAERGGGETCEIDLKISSVFSFDTGIEFEFDHAVVSFDPTDSGASLQVENDELGSDITLESNPEWGLTNKEATCLRWFNTLRDGDEHSPTASELTSRRATELINEIQSGGREA